MTELSEFRSEDYLENMDDAFVYLQTVFAENNPDMVAYSIGVVMRSVGFKKIAEECNMSAKSYHKSYCFGGNPKLGSLIAVLNAMGFELSIKKSKNFGTSSTKAERKQRRANFDAEQRPIL